MKILSFETNANKSDLLIPFLRSRLAIVDETTEVEEAIDLVKFYEFDVVLLRLSEDRLSDVDLIRKLRLARLRAPIVVLARSLNEAGRLRVLQAGADDLIVNALSHEEVFMKIQNLVRRSRGFQENALCIGSIEINMNAKKIYAKGKPVTLTKKEYQIAEILALRKGAVLARRRSSTISTAGWTSRTRRSSTCSSARSARSCKCSASTTSSKRTGAAATWSSITGRSSKVTSSSNRKCRRSKSARSPDAPTA